ncbi:MAG: hypothetical protein JXA33_23315 [Anaerolineae bacterium]|nr:hypothetical protein [Anaerolineae bacterium]
MNILNEAILLITQPPGDLVYFLVTLFALQQALFPTVTAWRTKPDKAWPRRWLWTLGMLLLSRIALIGIGLLSTAGFISPAVFLPPLERWIELLTVLWVMWAALPGPQTMRWQTGLILGLVGVSLIFYIYTAMTWVPWVTANYAYNGLLIERVWEWIILGILFVHLALAIVSRPPEWEWLVGMLCFWSLGHVAQILWPDTTTHLSGWLRLSTLVTFPLLSLLVNRQLLVPSSVSTPSPTAVPRGVIPTLPDVDLLQETLHIVESARQLEPSLIVASSKLAQLTGVEMCAIALPGENATAHPNGASTNTRERLRVVAVHPPTGQLETPELDLNVYNTLAEIYAGQQPRVIQPPDKETWLPAFYKNIGVRGTGPLVVYPMWYHKEQVGLLLLGNPESGNRWRKESMESHRLTATLLATAIVRGRNQGNEKASVLSRIRGQDTERQRLELELQQARQQTDTLKNRLTVLVTELKSRDQNLQRLRRELDSKASGLSQTELSFWQNEVQELAQERDKLLAQMQDIERDRQMLQEGRQRLAEELSDAKADLDTVEGMLVKLQHRVTELEQRPINAALHEEEPCNAFGMVVVGINGQIEMVDALARRMLHLPEGDITGLPIDGAYPEAEWTQLIAELLSNKGGARRRAHITLSEYGEIEADLVTLTDGDGQVMGLVMTLNAPESIVERREAIVSTAHEFRTPMTAVTGYTDLLLGEQAGILTEMQQQFLERVKANVEQMGHLLNDLISIVSPDSQSIELSPQPVDLMEIIEEAIMGLAARFRERKLTVHLDLPSGLPKAQADHDSLYQIMLRLLSNAVLCSKEGTAVTVSAHKETPETIQGTFILISVEDTGSGIAVEDYGRVFRRFYRANQPLIQGMGEKGVGMALAKMLVEANGGRIWVRSKPGVGSIFSLILPAALI